MWSRARTLSAEPELVRRRLRQAEGESEISKGKPSLGFLRGRRYKVGGWSHWREGKSFHPIGRAHGRTRAAPTAADCLLQRHYAVSHLSRKRRDLGETAKVRSEPPALSLGPCLLES